MKTTRILVTALGFALTTSYLHAQEMDHSMMSMHEHTASGPHPAKKKTKKVSAPKKKRPATQMDHSQMQGMDHSQMQGMDHSQMQGM
ncbi:MAG: hypothetical protein JSR70_08235, partial [Proteobacteria bacterium]|nr:hypothetical protein [Pseudomonadota bacterium]